MLINKCNCHSRFKREGARARRELQRDWITSLTCRDVIMSGRALWGNSFCHSRQQPAEHRRATSYLFPKLLYPSRTGALIQQPEIKPHVLQHRGHKLSGGWRYFLPPMLAENPLSTHTKNTWNEGNALQLVCTKLIRTGGYDAQAVSTIIFLAGPFVTEIHRVPAKEGKCGAFL